MCVCVCVLVAQSCPALCYSMDCSSRGSSVHGIFQARILDWVAMIFSRGSSQPRNQTQISCIAGRFFTIRATREAPLLKKQAFTLWASQVLLVVICQCRRHKRNFQFLGREDPLEEGMVTHSSILAGRIPWTEGLGGLKFVGSQRVRHD